MTRSFAQPLTNAHEALHTRLQGSWLVIARVIWVILVILTLSGFVAMLPASYTQIRTVCTGSNCVLGQPSLVAVQALQEHGLTVENYGVFAIALTILVTVICIVVALIIFWRRSDDWIALLVALTLVMEGTTLVTYMLMWSHSVWQIPAIIMSTLSWSTIFLSFSLFPDGRFVPHWTRWLVITWLGCNILSISFPFLFFFTLFSNLI